MLQIVGQKVTGPPRRHGPSNISKKLSPILNSPGPPNFRGIHTLCTNSVSREIVTTGKVINLVTQSVCILKIRR